LICVTAAFSTALVSCIPPPTAFVELETLTAIPRVYQFRGESQATAFAQFRIGGTTSPVVIELAEGSSVSVNGVALNRANNVEGFLGPLYTNSLPPEEPPDGQYTFQIDDTRNLVSLTVEPPEPIEITRPEEGTTLDPQNALTVEWQQLFPDSEDTISITVIGPDGENPSQLIRLGPFSPVGDPGVIAIENIASIGSGEGTITIERTRSGSIENASFDGEISSTQAHTIRVNFQS